MPFFPDKNKYRSSESVSRARVGIINSVLKNGLLSGELVERMGLRPFNSQDSINNQQVFYISLPHAFGRRRIDPEEARGQIEYSLNNGTLGVFPVMTERESLIKGGYGNSSLKEDQTSQNTLVNNARLSSTFAIVFTLPPEVGPYDTVSQVGVDQFVSVLMPEAIAAEYLRANPNPPFQIISVGTIAATISRGGYSHRLEVPNYRDALVELIVADPSRELYCSGIRLPVDSNDLTS